MIYLAVSLTVPESDLPCCFIPSSQKWLTLLCCWQFPLVIHTAVSLTVQKCFTLLFHWQSPEVSHLAVSLTVPRNDSLCCVPDSSQRLWALCWGHWRVWRRGASRPTMRYTMSQTANTTMHNWRSALHIILCVCVWGGGGGGGRLSSASSQDESSALHNGNCIAPFSASTQTLRTIICCCCCCCWLFVTLN